MYSYFLPVSIFLNSNTKYFLPSKLKDKKTGKVKEVVKKFKNIITSLGSGDK